MVDRVGADRRCAGARRRAGLSTATARQHPQHDGLSRRAAGRTVYPTLILIVRTTLVPFARLTFIFTL